MTRAEQPETRWDWKNDVNVDGKVTISDLRGWVSWVFFWPGDWIIDLVIENAPAWAEFFELNDDPFKGVLLPRHHDLPPTAPAFRPDQFSGVRSTSALRNP